jgi:trehalose 6-phosphate synthase
MKRSLIVAANRGPINVRALDDGSLVAGHGVGGLAPSLARALDGRGALWIAAAASDAERQLARGARLASEATSVELDYIDFETELLNSAYNVIANQTLWYLHHGMFDHIRRPVFDRAWNDAWEDYRAYNVAFAARISERAAVGATVVVNDYHLSLVGVELARRRPDLLTVHFTHTPFATREELSVLPRAIATELVAALSEFGALGFHASRWMERFAESAEMLTVQVPELFVAPLGADPEELEATATAPAVLAARERIRQRIAGRQLIVRSDRIEPSKNIVRGILAFEELLDSTPSLCTRVRFIMRAYASRTAVADYVAYGDEIQRAATRVNAKFSDEAGSDVIEFDNGDDFAASVAALSLYDVLLVNPIRDGMNLVAKEGPIVNTADGVLVLSREAGAFAELGADAIPVDPFDVSMTAEAMRRALSLSTEDRKRRAASLSARAAVLPPSKWLDEVMAHAQARKSS